MKATGTELYVTFDIGENYLIDVGVDEKTFGQPTWLAWLYRKDVGMKIRLCGAPVANYSTAELFADSTKDMWKHGIDSYEAELLESPVFAPTL